MGVFDLVFLTGALVSIGMLVAAAISALSGKGKRSLKTLLALGIGVLAYLALGLMVSFSKQQRMIAVGEPWCFDDWCLTVDRAGRTPSLSPDAYKVDFH